MIPLLLAAALCLPPGMPPLETLHAVRGNVYTIEGQRETERFMAVGTTYAADDGRAWTVFKMLGAAAIVDDHPEDETATAWWIDPGLVTDDIPPKAQADAKSTCLFRRRGEST